MCVERQNVVAKSNISTMLKNLKPRTISFSTRGMLIPIFWQFVEGLAIVDVVRAKKQHMIVSWVCQKMVIIYPFSEPSTKKTIYQIEILDAVIYF